MPERTRVGAFLSRRDGAVTTVRYAWAYVSSPTLQRLLANVCRHVGAPVTVWLIPLAQRGPSLAPALVFLLVTVLATWNLTSFPATWYDEGVNLQAARNLARSGSYALAYAEQDVRPFDPQLTTGPTVIVPVAMVFKVFGAGLMQGRLVMVAYVLLAALGLYRAARSLYGPTVAMVAVLVLCAVGRASPTSTRDVVGEAAALALLFWGAQTFIVARRGGATVHFATAGLLFGLAILTKAQFTLLLPILAAAWLVTRGRSTGFLARHLFIALAGPVALGLAWQVYQVTVLGLSGFATHVREQSRVVSVSALGGPLGQAYVATRTLFFWHMATLGLIGLGYVWLTMLRRGLRDEPAERLLLPAFGAGWLVWFVGFSVGYDRYAAPLVAVCSVFLAVLYRDLIVVFRVPRGAVTRSLRHPLVGDSLQPALMLLLVAPIAMGIGTQIVDIARPAEPAAQEIAAVISRQVEPGAIVESFDWQLDVLAEETYHHPPLEVTLGAVLTAAHSPLNAPLPQLAAYDPPGSNTYLVDGHWSKLLNVYRNELSKDAYQRIATAGDYDLYRRTLTVDSTTR
jgi:hypothetical protein